MLSKLTHFSLFSGIGGIDLAAEWADFETIGQCEFADYQTRVLEKHWPDVPRWRDIRDVTADSFRERTGLRTVDLISGGFPCQPFSVAGNQKGKEDERYLWPEMLRVIRELKPCWVLGENVPGILRIAGRTVCEDLEREGYAVTIFNFEAAAVGAPHRRERVFFVGNTKRCGLSRESRGRSGQKFANGYLELEKRFMANTDVEWELQSSRFFKTLREWPCDGSQNVADNDNERLQTGVPAGDCGKQVAETQHNGTQTTGYGNGGIRTWWSAEPDVGRVAHGIPSRVDRLRCLGNAVVPQQVYPILQAIADIEATIRA